MNFFLSLKHNFKTFLKFDSKKIVIFSLFILNSCSYYIELNEEKETFTVLASKQKLNYCQTDLQSSFFSVNPHASKAFSSFLKRVPKKNIGFVETSVLWSLIQMNYLPHLSSPSARLHLILKTRSGFKYWDFFVHPNWQKIKRDKLNFMPYLYGLEFLLKKYKSKHSLDSLAKIIDRYFQEKIIVDKELSKFVSRFSGNLFKMKAPRSTYFKSNQPIQKNESISKFHYRSIVKSYHQHYKYISKMRKEFRGRPKSKRRFLPFPYLSNQLLFPFKQDKNSSKDSQIECSFDLNMYKYSIFPISPVPVKINTFGHHRNLNYFWASSITNHRGRLKNVKNTPLLIFDRPKKVAPFCHITLQDRREYLLFSRTGRDPGQYLFNAILRGIHRSSNMREYSIHINHPRRLFLSNPVRIIYESQRGGQKLLNSFLKINIPVYHHSSLGELVGLSYYPERRELSMFSDIRGPSRPSCSKPKSIDFTIESSPRLKEAK